ncbi:uncharacterized protein N7483_011204 [Penicillium malachiteum]|uniref:uncharacterized protein n=1 Tax=Penicillium malachiteum TaxID=1324776 RepID=UPI0025473485|nr:uncharacterized protein N7483_011204 [Penicillium malachiteum]KAJ5714023.1 hypothetical protein N7483_011204 [Penicillium malachiteum]
MSSSPSKLRVVSLGSSFAAGPGINPQVAPLSAKRSGQNYPHLLAKELDAELTDLSVSGATLLNITTTPQNAIFSKDVFEPQILSVPTDADIITLTAGGNDIGYIGDMMFDAGKATTVGMVANCIIQAAKPIMSIFCRPAEKSTPLTPEGLSQRLGETLDAIHERAPNAHIYLVEYLAILGPITKPAIDIPFNQERIDHHSQVASALQNAFATAADTRSEWCERVPIHELSSDHVLGSKEPWVGGFALSSLFRGGIVLHPNLDGMKAIAKILLLKIRQEFPKKA